MPRNQNSNQDPSGQSLRISPPFFVARNQLICLLIIFLLHPSSRLTLCQPHTYTAHLPPDCPRRKYHKHHQSRQSLRTSRCRLIPRIKLTRIPTSFSPHHTPCRTFLQPHQYAARFPCNCSQRKHQKKANTSVTLNIWTLITFKNFHNTHPSWSFS